MTNAERGRIRKKVESRILCLVSLVLLAASFSAAQEADVEGSRDHPLINRYPGSWITEYDQKQFDEYVLALGPIRGGAFQKTQRFEGKITHIRYQNPTGRSSLEIFRNYEAAVRQAGFQTLFTCKQQECGEFKNTDEGTWRLGWFGFQDANNYNRYLVAKLVRPEGDVYLAVNFYESQSEPYRTTTLQVVEMKPMEAGLVTVNAASLASDIASSGHVSVYGIYFDTGKADVKPESDVTLKEIAKLLQQNANLKLYVVGHTDNQGTPEANMDLSMRRANAVVQSLSGKYGVAAARLKALGDGSSAPVASNDTEEGRAKNRRVELVKQ